MDWRNKLTVLVEEARKRDGDEFHRLEDQIEDIIIDISSAIDAARDEGEKKGEKMEALRHPISVSIQDQWETIRELISKLPGEASAKVHLKGLKIQEVGRLDITVEDLTIDLKAGDNIKKEESV